MFLAFPDERDTDEVDLDASGNIEWPTARIQDLLLMPREIPSAETVNEALRRDVSVPRVCNSSGFLCMCFFLFCFVFVSLRLFVSVCLSPGE
jgi:hypothetical protein